MFRQFTMILLAVAVLFGSTHASSWAHDHAESDHHAVVAHADDHDSNHAGDLDSDHDQIAGQEALSDTADVNGDIKGDVVGHHSHPFGVAAAAMPYGLGRANTGMLIVVVPEQMLASFSEAPPTQPPSA